MESNYYTVLAPDSPTHYPDIHHHSPDVLDIAIVKTSNIQFNIENLNELSSDHNPILLDICGQNQYLSPFNHKKTIINWNRFSIQLHNTVTNPNPDIRTKDDLDEAATSITAKFQTAISNNSTTLIKNLHKDLPHDIKKALTKKRRLRRTWQHSRDPEVKRLLNQQTEIVRQKLTDHRANEWHQTIDNLKPNDPKLFKINRGLISNKQAKHPLQGSNGLVYDPKDKAELFASELVRQFSCPTGVDFTDKIVEDQIKVLKLQHPKLVQPISPVEVWETIRKLPGKKAPGPDKISNTALKKASKKTILHLTKIFNCCLRLEHFPNPWKQANVVMIPKAGKNKLTPTNHRPISLLNTMSKLLETLILIRLKKSIANSIRPEQFAFRQGHSTTIQLTNLVDELAISFNRKERTAAVFLDFEKAFDKVWHQGLLAKMLRMNIPVQLVNLVKSFLEGRNFRVRVEDTLSSSHPISAGVPQGSCISPTLFTIYINDLPSSPGIKTNLFADDTMFYATSMNKQHAAKKLQIQVDLALTWLRDWRISINPKKTVAILFGDKKATNLKPIKINGQDIKWQPTVKYLGVTLDSGLKFNNHIVQSTTKARRIRAALYPMLNSHSPLPIQVKLSIIKMYISTILSYAGPAWGALISNSNWKKIEAVQNIALRTITGTPWFVRNDVLRHSLRVKSIKDSVITASHRMFHQTTTSKHLHLNNLGLANATADWKRIRPARLLDIVPNQ